MKIAVSIFLFALILHPLFSQQQVERENTLRQLATLAPNSAGTLGFDNRYEGVKGTPYLFDEYQKGKLMLKDGESFNKNFSMKIDITNNNLLLLFSDSKGGLGMIPASDIASIEMQNILHTTPLSFKTFPAEAFEKSKNDNLLYEVLHEGDITLLKLHTKYLQKANYKGAYSLDQRSDEFIKEETYYIRAGNSPFKKIKLKKKSLLSVLPNYSNKIKIYTKRNNLNLTNEKDLVAILAELDKHNDK